MQHVERGKPRRGGAAALPSPLGKVDFSAHSAPKKTEEVSPQYEFASDFFILTLCRTSPDLANAQPPSP